MTRSAVIRLHDHDDVLIATQPRAAGAKVRSEELGYGNDEFLPWHVGAVM